jgi:uncharacterized protein (TIGR02145 family)
MSLAFTSPLRRSLRAISVSMVLFALVFIASCKMDEDTNDTPSDNNPQTTFGQPGAGGTDQEGDAFTSVIIGSQEWMSENLNVASYTDGTPIPYYTHDELIGLTIGAWTESYNGRLYNWYAVAGIYDEASAANPALRKQLAPDGWHVPSDSEWTTMINFLDPTADGGNNYYNDAGGMMKTAGTNQDGTGLWNAPNTMANNASGFSGDPAGYLTHYGYFEEPFSVAYWWSSTEFDIDRAWNRNLHYQYGNVSRRSDLEKGWGFSVRCMRD